MAQKARKNAVRDIIRNLLESEIPEIQNVAKQLAERIKQLEEHGWKLEHYATEIESLAEQESEVSTEVSLGELIKDLEKTLDELRQRPGGAVAEAKLEGEAEKKAEAEKEAEEEVGEPEALKRERVERRPGVELETYTTPEGFVVRKRR